MKKRIVFLLTALFVFAFSSLASANVEMGMTGSVVQSVQYMLIDTGYLSDGADGVFGSGTQSAVRRFQADHGLDADGVVGTQTMQALADASGREVPEESGSYQYSMVMDATAYTADDPGNSGITAGGHRLTHGLVSVDPDVIPLGTRLYIEGYGDAIVDDTGGAIVGNRIDLGMDDRDEALNFGRQNVVVHVL